MYQVEHPISLQVSGLDKPKRKRGRPPKKQKTAEEIAQETPKTVEIEDKTEKDDDERSGKRRRKTPTRFKEAVQVCRKYLRFFSLHIKITCDISNI